MASEKRLIDANMLKANFPVMGKYVDDLYPSGVVRRAIDNAPTVDAVEVPPVKIGDTAYFIINKKIYEAVICLIAFSQYRFTTTTEIRGEVQRCHTVSASFPDWGKTVFLTKEEAQAALAKMDLKGE